MRPQPILGGVAATDNKKKGEKEKKRLVRRALVPHPRAIGPRRPLRHSLDRLLSHQGIWSGEVVRASLGERAEHHASCAGGLAPRRKASPSCPQPLLPPGARRAASPARTDFQPPPAPHR